MRKKSDFFKRKRGDRVEVIMKKSGITVDFLINKMQEAAGIEDKEYFQQEFKKVLSENIDCLETAALEAEKDDDAESAIEIRNDVERFRRELDFDIDFEDFQNLMEQILGIHEDNEIEHEYLRVQKKNEHIANCARKYINIINRFPEEVEYKIDFSNRSQSIYLVTNLPVTEENIEKFTTDSCYCNVTYNDTYTTDTVEIRLSDHDFGGNINHSYMSPCVNIVVNFGRYEK